ncbi:MAG: hypothetical protein HRU75_06540 [Planctomycetia bacterium]|nr:MAG: hypothetical protein HRU75_06540 [Planctomycetia bacterium]
MTRLADPYCSNCGYSLIGATETSKCPECGRPLVEVLTRDIPASATGLRRKSEVLLFGLPLVDVAFGPHGMEKYGHARGFLAVGDVATGVIAVGGRAQGLFAFGGLSIGLFSFGGMALGLVSFGGFAIALALACGGFALGAVAFGGMTAGGYAVGGVATGYAATGGMAYGWFVESPTAFGRYVLSRARRDPEAVAFFTRYGGIRNVIGNLFGGLWLIAFVLFTVAISVAPGIVTAAARRWALRKPRG